MSDEAASCLGCLVAALGFPIAVGIGLFIGALVAAYYLGVF